MAAAYGRNRTAGRAYAPAEDTDVVTARTTVPFLRRISWGAVLAGVVVALVTQIGINALGLAFGAASIEPQFNATPTWPEFTSGVVIWMAASMLLSLFAGGYVAGRMAGTISHTEGIIHGITAWAVTALLTLWLVTSGAGGIIGGIANVLGSGLSLATTGAAAIAPEVASALESQDIEVQSIFEEISGLTAQTGTTEADGDAGTTPGTNGGSTGGSTGGTSASGEPMNFSSGVYTATTQGTAAQRRVQIALAPLFLQGADADDTARENAVQVLTANTNLTEEQAREQIATWETQLTQFRDDAAAAIEQAAGDFADAVAAVAGVLFAAMIVGAAAAAGGGLVGVPSAKYIVNKTEQAAEDMAEARAENRAENRTETR